MALILLTTGCDTLGSSTDPTPETSGITITTNSSGPSLDPDGYVLTVDGSQTQSIAANGTASFSGLSAGPHSVELSEVAENCGVGSPNPQTVPVAPGGTASVSFQVSCVPVLSSKIVFHTERDGTDGTAIYMMNADGAEQVELVDGTGDEVNPAVSPDGTKVAYNKGEDIWVANSDGSNAINLTQHLAIERRPSWSPDGTKIAFLLGSRREPGRSCREAAGGAARGGEGWRRRQADR
jgi:Tol biopolymer transport system component